MKQLFYTFILSVFILSISSCEKDDDTTIDSNPNDTTSVVDTSNTDTSNTDTNQKPVANSDTATTQMNTEITIDLLSNDTDQDNDDLSITSISNASNGSFVNNNDGSITYSPEIVFAGKEVLTYTISDGEASSTASVIITVGNAKQKYTYDSLSGYLDVEMTMWGASNNKLKLKSDGTFLQQNTGPVGFNDYDGVWNINTNGEIVFENSELATFEVSEYKNTVGSTTYSGYSFGNNYDYVQL
jgi:hypothetical protein